MPAAGWITFALLGLNALSPLSNAQDLTILSRHTGTFLLGQTNASYLLWVRNAGAAATSGLVSVTENAPAGLTVTSMQGLGWDCGANSCSRTDPLAAGTSYAAITVMVSVGQSAGSGLTNQAAVSGGGDVNTANNTASDSTTIAA